MVDFTDSNRVNVILVRHLSGCGVNSWGEEQNHAKYISSTALTASESSVNQSHKNGGLEQQAGQDRSGSAPQPLQDRSRQIYY